MTALIASQKVQLSSAIVKASWNFVEITQCTQTIFVKCLCEMILNVKFFYYHTQSGLNVSDICVRELSWNYVEKFWILMPEMLLFNECKMQYSKALRVSTETLNI